jgi:serine/threonine protein kinase
MLLGSGSFGYVFKLQLNCADAIIGKLPPGEIVSKVMTRRDAAEELNNASIIVEKFDPGNKFTIVPTGMCTINKNVRDQIKSFADDSIFEYFRRRHYDTVLFSAYGGMSLRDVYHILEISDDVNTRLRIAFSLCNMFTSVANMNRHNWVHNDIKDDNIAWDGSVARLIDFGVSRSLKKSLVPGLAYDDERDISEEEQNDYVKKVVEGKSDIQPTRDLIQVAAEIYSVLDDDTLRDTHPTIEAWLEDHYFSDEWQFGVVDVTWDELELCISELSDFLYEIFNE